MNELHGVREKKKRDVGLFSQLQINLSRASIYVLSYFPERVSSSIFKTIQKMLSDLNFNLEKSELAPVGYGPFSLFL